MSYENRSITPRESEGLEFDGSDHAHFFGSIPISELLTIAKRPEQDKEDEMSHEGVYTKIQDRVANESDEVLRRGSEAMVELRGSAPEAPVNCDRELKTS